MSPNPGWLESPAPISKNPEQTKENQIPSEKSNSKVLTETPAEVEKKTLAVKEQIENLQKKEKASEK